MRPASLLPLLLGSISCTTAQGPGADTPLDAADSGEHDPAEAVAHPGPDAAAGAQPGTLARIAVHRAQFAPTAAGSLRSRVRLGMSAELDGRGLIAGAGSDELGLATVAYGGLALGRPEPELHDCAPINPAASLCAAGAALDHGLLTEWWVAHAGGLRQGWTLHTPSVGGPIDDPDIVVIEVAPTLGRLLQVDPDGLAATFAGSTGRTWRYGGLAAWDADGHELPAELQNGGGVLQVVVDTAGARWPVTVDPALDTELELTASDGAAGDAFGYALAGAGDVNGDGYDDVVVGARHDDDGGTDSGAVYLYYGSSTGVALSTEQKITASDADAYDDFGQVVAGAGDVDGDGYDDIVVGARYDDDGAYRAGAAYVYYGSATGLAASSEEKLTASDAATADYYGTGVAGGMDLDGDGYDDIAVGASSDDDGAVSSGSVYVYYGGSTRALASSEQKLVASDGDDYDLFGTRLFKGGDLDADGYDELVVGAILDDDGGSDAGAVYVYYGSSTGISAASEQKLVPADLDANDDLGRAAAAGDLDADGYDDLVAPARFDNDGGGVYVYYGSSSGLVEASVQELSASDGQYGDWYGYSVGTVDVDGDGYADIIVGASRWDGDGTNLGAAYVYYGSISGAVAASEEQLTASNASDNLAFGIAVADLGDVDGDDVGDVGVGAYYASSVPTYVGAVYVYNGECETDVDGDGACSGVDCDDNDATIHPGAVEVCNGVDDDCNGDIDDDDVDVDVTTLETFYADADGDGYGDPAAPTEACDVPSGYAEVDTDCDDTDSSIRPDATEGVGDEVDQDCDGAEICYVDADDDGYIDGITTVASSDTDCSDAGEGLASDGTGECDDTDATIHPGATEGVGDEVDQDCDETEICYADADDDGYIDGSTTASSDTDCSDPGEGLATDETGECDDADATIHPTATELVGDEVDGDCDGIELCYTDADDDGFVDRSAGTVASSDADCTDTGEAARDASVGDCDDADASVYPGATELPGDEVDSDCDGAELCYVDGDGDGYTDGTSGVLSEDADCGDVGEATSSAATGDCDDSDATMHPDAEDLVADGVDSDCDGHETCYADADLDGYIDGSTTLTSTDGDCDDAGEADATAPTGECDDENPSIYPGAAEEVGDGIDSDCDGGEICFVDADDDGFVEADGGGVVASVDADCDDAGEGSDADAVGDCDDGDAAVNPGMGELPGDEVDGDCDAMELCFADADDDGYPDFASTVPSADADCQDPGEGTATEPAGECDDTDAGIHPDVADIEGDGIDQDCDGQDATIPEAVSDSPGKGGSCATVAHPTSVWMLLTGLLALVGRRRRVEPSPDLNPADRPWSH